MAGLTGTLQGSLQGALNKGQSILDHFLPGEDPAELSDQTPLITGGILDSIRTLKLVVFLEDRFGVTVEAHEAGVENLDGLDRVLTERAGLHDQLTGRVGRQVDQLQSHRVRLE